MDAGNLIRSFATDYNIRVRFGAPDGLRLHP
jgi:hypothetical protein